MESRPKRTIIPKRKDDEIYTSIQKRPKITAVETLQRGATARRGRPRKTIDERDRETAEGNDKGTAERKLTPKKTSKMKLTDENAAIFRRMEELSHSKESQNDSETENESENLPKKRIPKPSFKVRIKEENADEYFEGSSDEYLPSDISDVSLSDDETYQVEYTPRKTPKKIDKDIAKENENDSGKRPPKKHGISFLNKDTSNDDTDKNSPDSEKVDELIYSEGKELIPGKDKVIPMSNNRMYFEFAVPKKKVILQVKPPLAGQEFKSETLMELVTSLRTRDLIKNDTQELLEAFRKLPDGVFRENVKARKTNMEAVMKFATVLYLYSPKAYDLVSTVLYIPDRSALQNRIHTRNYFPGFTQEALELLVVPEPNNLAESACSIMLDFVTIRKDCHYDKLHNRWIGHVDLCGGPTPVDSDEIPLASEILMLTAVGIGRDWKLPFGYFLANGLSGEALHSIVTEAIVALEDCGLKVRVIVCEGTPNTMKMAVAFGCNIHTKSFREVVTSIPHPVNENKRLHIMFGIHHALSLLRKLLLDETVLWSSTYGIIKSKYFSYLWGLQEKSGTGSTKKLEPKHVELVSLQKILRQCRPSFSWMENRCFELAEETKMKEFSGCSSAANFVADIYRAFDLLNSRNPVTTGEKPPVTNPFMPEQLESMSIISQRIFGLEFHNGEKIINDGRWLSIMLFSLTLKSASVSVFDILNEGVLSYIRTYRLNLDHSDMLLSCIQRYGGWERDIPTASEFRQGYKTLLELSKSSKISVFRNDFDGNDLTVGQGVICPFRRHVRTKGYDDIAFAVKSSPVIDLSIEWEIKAKCILKHISDRLTCVDCMSLLLETDNFVNYKIQNIAPRFVKPSKFLLHLLKFCEFKLRAKLVIFKQLELESLLIHIFSDYFCDNLFRTHYIPGEHLLEEPFHIVSLIKVIIRIFLNYRLNFMKHITLVKSRLMH